GAKASGGWRSSTGTCITATARSTSSRAIRTCSTSRPTSTRTIRARALRRRWVGRRAQVGRATCRSLADSGTGRPRAPSARWCRQLAPDFVLVSAGFDCDHRDPRGGMQVTPAGFAAMGRACVDLAAETAGGRIAAVLEGGYDLDAIVEGVDATLAALQGAHAV